MKLPKEKNETYIYLTGALVFFAVIIALLYLAYGIFQLFDFLF